MTSYPNTTNTRPGTPSNLLSHLELNDTASFSVDDESPAPCTPPHSRIPLIFKDAPPAPRPRKRVYQPSHFLEGDLDSIMMPTSMDMTAEEEESPVLIPESPMLRFPLTARPAFPRVPRRKVRRSGDENEDDDDMVVRLTYRPTIDLTGDDDDEEEPVAKENSHRNSNKLWSAHSSPAPLLLKRRNSYNALCA